MSAGVLNQDELRKVLFEAADPAWEPCPLNPADRPSPDGSAIDLPLGGRFWEMKASCRPTTSRSVRQLLLENAIGESQPLTPATMLRTGKVYWIELACTKLVLPRNICARATAKSTIGRLDAMVRLVADREEEFDKISSSQARDVSLEVVPISFNLKVSPGKSLSQLRLIRGDESICRVPAEAIKLEEDVLIDKNRNPAEITLFPDDRFAVPLRLDLSLDPSVNARGFEAVPSTVPDFAINPWVREVDPQPYWKPVESDGSAVTIKKDRFYIFRSLERFRIPSQYCVDCRAYSEGLGDIRIHYAGFAHPMFGRKDKDGRNVPNGAPLIFEVRGFSMDSMLRNGATLAKVYFLRMSTPTEFTDGKYSDQELKLSSAFKDWPAG
ncbi:MAG: 2'-deoxycytidine 5'-triphosphate deaminase [Phycisphaerae bacterium]|nr:2'-deoxycytidine 5'-triphosphate deaminase [Phycisphaerae bacterium]